MPSDDLLLISSRLQFGLTASFHYIFVPLTLGLALSLALMDTVGLLRRHPILSRAALFWNRFFVLAWLMGFATGYPLRMQLADRWARYSEQTRAVLHELMGFEGWLAPGMLVLVVGLALGAGQLPLAWRLACRWLLLASMLAQSVCIILMNTWMQHPVGTRWREDRGAELVALLDVFLNPMALHKLGHVFGAAMLTGALFIAAVSAFYLLRLRHIGMAKASLKIALPLAGVSLFLVLLTGHGSARDVMVHQPMKFAALEAHWTRGEGPAPMVLMGLPDMSQQRNLAAMEVPYLMSWLAMHGNEAPLGVNELVVRASQRIIWAMGPGANDPSGQGWRQLYAHVAAITPGWSALPESERMRLAALASRPHVPTLFFAFRMMACCGLVLAGALAWLAWRWRRTGAGPDRPAFVVLCVCMPLPWVATLAGWVVAEAGRQPWVVYEQMATAAAVVLPSAAQTIGQLSCWCILYAVMALGFGMAVRSLVLRGPGDLIPARSGLSCDRLGPLE